MRGYYIDTDYTHKGIGDVKPAEVFVYLGDGEAYAPIGQHVQVAQEYVEDCKQITKEDYLSVSKNLYTPKEYLDDIE